MRFCAVGAETEAAREAALAELAATWAALPPESCVTIESRAP